MRKMTLEEFARKGGKARAKTLTQEERTRIAREGGKARAKKAAQKAKKKP